MFTRMDHGTKEDWAHISREHGAHFRKTPQIMTEMLWRMQDVSAGFACDQLHHMLMTATLAERDGASDEMVLISLFHDIGKVVSIPNHGAIGAEILRPYVSENSYHILRTHQDFQGKYYYQYFDMPTNLRDQYKDEPWHADACRFSDEWDQAAFDPDFAVEPVGHFENLIEEFFARPKM